MTKDSLVGCKHLYGVAECTRARGVTCALITAAIISRIDAILRTSRGLKYGNDLAVVEVEMTATVA